MIFGTLVCMCMSSLEVTKVPRHNEREKPELI